MKVGIIGAGAMGSGIAQVAAEADEEVVLYDKYPSALEKSETKFRKLMARLVKKGKYSQEKVDVIFSNLRYSDQWADLAGRDMIIEAAIEELEIKQELFRGIEDLVEDTAILATNTSSLSITAIAAAVKDPARVVGMHFFNPAPLMKLVEVIPAMQTSEATTQRVMEIARTWNKTAVKAKDTPGFIVNRIARPFYGEAIRIYEEAIADIPTIDWAMKEIGGFRMGPFTLMDYIGNDINYAVTEIVFKAFYYDRRYIPSLTQKRMVEAGWLGRKSGRGFYDYSDEAEEEIPLEDQERGRYILNRIVAMLINEAADAYYLNIANRDDIDLAMTQGVNYPKGLLKWADKIGIAECVRQMDELHYTYREERYRCSPLLRIMATRDETFY